MALGNVQIYDEGAFGYPGDDVYIVVANGSAPSILPGEPVRKTLGTKDVFKATTNTPVVATDFWTGIASTTSTESTTLDGVVRVTKMLPGMSYLVAPKVAATWDTQAKYDALVGARVLMDLTSSVFSILATDGATNGLVVLDLDIAKFPGKVRFAIRNGVNWLS